jgi:hypothetical protein
MVALLVDQPRTIVVATLFPALELHTSSMPLGRARRGDAEQILNIDDAEPANLHVMAA